MDWYSLLDINNIHSDRPLYIQDNLVDGLNDLFTEGGYGNVYTMLIWHWIENALINIQNKITRKQCLHSISAALPTHLGMLYYNHKSDQIRKMIRTTYTMAEEIRTSLRQLIISQQWLLEKEKKEMLEYLNTIKVNIDFGSEIINQIVVIGDQSVIFDAQILPNNTFASLILDNKYSKFYTLLNTGARYMVLEKSIGKVHFL